MRARLAQLLLRRVAGGHGDDQRPPSSVAATSRSVSPTRTVDDGPNATPYFCDAFRWAAPTRRGRHIIRPVTAHIQVENTGMIPQQAKLGLRVRADVPGQHRLHDARI